MVEILNLRKSYGKLEVLRGISLTLKPGGITAIVGPNAAGKSTLIKCILGLVLPDSGDIRVDGQSVRSGWGYRQKIGYMAQTAKFPEHLTLREIVVLVENVREESPSRLEELLDFFGLRPHYERPIRTLSGGTRQKANALLAFLFDPRICILDEPTAGLDPLISSRFKDRLLETKDAGKLVIISSHHMAELEDLADRVIFLLDGQVRFDGTLSGLMTETDTSRLERAVANLMVKKWERTGSQVTR